jgi:F-type H+-transporting ATPase subunit a
MRRLGCSAKILIPVVAVLLILFIVGFVIGPIGSSLFNIKPPDFLAISTPKVELPAESVAHLSLLSITNTLLASWLTIIVLAVLFYFCTRKMKLVPGRLQCFAEFIVETLNNFVKGIAGDKNARRLLPMIATIFLFILGNAILALLPIFGTIGLNEGGTMVPLFRSANTDVNLPLALAIIAFSFIEYLGFREIGGLHYINGFFKFEVLGEGFKNLFKGKIKPAMSGIFMGAINLFIGFIEVLSHFIRLVSFTFRLFGNMTAGEILLLVITFLVPFVTSTIFYSLELFFGFIQALIFASLTLVWSVIALTPHEEE